MSSPQPSSTTDSTDPHCVVHWEEYESVHQVHGPFPNADAALRYADRLTEAMPQERGRSFSVYPIQPPNEGNFL
jgi:hypothetical protein